MEYQIIQSSTKEAPLVSVIIPMYNVEDYIYETIQSVLDQTIEKFELILVDDGSSDGTVEKVKEVVSKINNVTLVTKSNSGPGASRNLGVKLARGEYISFVDSDDLIPEDALENMYNAAKEYNVDLVTGMSKSFNSERSWFIASHMNSGAYDEGMKDLFANPEMLYTLGPCNKMFKRELLEGVEYPANIKVTEDHPFIIHAYLKAKKFYTLDKIIYYYRQREDEDNISLSQMVNEKSAPVINDVFNSLKLSDQLWDRYVSNKYMKDKMKINYYNRIIRADLWPAVNKSIKGKNAKDQEEVFSLMKEWIQNMDRNLFNQLPLISHMMTFQILNRYLYLSKKAKDIHRSLLVILTDKLNPDNINILLSGKRGIEIKSTLKAGKKNSTVPMYSYLVKRNINKRITNFKKNFGVKFAKKIVYPFAKLLPIQDKKIMFATNKDQRFSGSFKVIFDELSKLDHNYQVVGHFKKNRQFKELAKLYYDLATAKYVLLDDYYFQMYGLRTRKSTEVIQLWHAAGAFKKFGISSIGSLDSNTLEFENAAHQNYTQVIVSGESVAAHYANAFGVSVDNVHPLGVPRTDMFLDDDYKDYVRETYFKSYPQLKGKKIITYAPTFRGRPGARATFKLELDLEKLYKELGDEYIVILKMHPSVTKGIHIPNELSEFVINMSKNDVNNVLIMTDILITDYSSIVFDYALLNRPMIFFAYDLEEYLEERGFYEKYEDFVPGPIVDSTEDIVKLVKNQGFNPNQVEDFAKKYFDNLDGKSGERIVKQLFFK